MSPRAWSRLEWSVLVAVVLAGISPVSARASAELVRPPQLDAANAVGLAYTRIHPPVIRRVCLADTGVTHSLETTRVVARLPLDGGVDDIDGQHRHGTSMAMHMAAERNGVGMVGVWSLGELVSYRAVREGTSGASFNDYYLAIRACVEQPGVAVIALPLAASYEGTAEEEALVKDAITLAHANGINLVAAAGNGGPVAAPAKFDGVFAVAAGAPAGGYCAFASRGPEVDLVAPGCGLAEASPFTLEPQLGEGSSQAVAMTAMLIAALRSYEPALSEDAAEGAVRMTGDHLDVGRLFRARGLGFVIDDGLSAAPPLPDPSSDGEARSRLPPPQLRRYAVRRCSRLGEFATSRCVRLIRRYREVRLGVEIRLRRYPSDAKVEIRVDAGRGTLRRHRTFVRRTRRIVLPVPRDWQRLRLRFVPAVGARTLPSTPVFVRRR